MDVLALEAKGVKAESGPTPASSKPRSKQPKKAKRIVYFEVEIVDAKTREKLLLLDKVMQGVFYLQEILHKYYCHICFIN